MQSLFNYDNIHHTFRIYETEIVDDRNFPCFNFDLDDSKMVITLKMFICVPFNWMT